MDHRPAIARFRLHHVAPPGERALAVRAGPGTFAPYLYRGRLRQQRHLAYHTCPFAGLVGRRHNRGPLPWRARTRAVRVVYAAVRRLLLAYELCLESDENIPLHQGYQNNRQVR